MHNSIKALLVLTILALAAMSYASTGADKGPGVGVPAGIEILMQINDARGAPTGYELCTPWPKGLNHTKPYSFAAGKNFTLIIREIAKEKKYPEVFKDLRISAVANNTGFVKFSYTTTDADPTKKTDWYVAIVVEWPAKDYYFLVYNKTFEGISLLDLQYELSGDPTKDGTETRTGPWGVLTLKHGAGNFGNLSSSVIHTFYVGIDTLERQYDLTFTRTVTIAGKTFTLDDAVAPRPGPTKYVKEKDPRVTAVFGPFTYLGTYITSFGDPGKDNISIDNTKVKYNHQVYVTLEGYRAVIIRSENRIYTTDPIAPKLRHFAKTFNWTTATVVDDNVVMSCNLVIWQITAYMFKVTGLYDLKGNPIFNPEAFRFKLQAKVNERWLTLDRVQGSWRADIPNVVSAIAQACGFTSAADVTAANLLKCYREMGKEKFADAVFSLYELVTLVRLASVKMVNNEERKASPQDLPTKLVVEYVYYEGSNVVNALVLEAPLAAAANYEGRLTVSILPIQIKLWRWGNDTLPLPERQYYYTDPLDLVSLKFVAQGDTMYVAKMGTEAVSLDPWTGQAVWVLPPYQLVPGLVGNVKATLLVGFNASGYLPMPTLVANLTTTGIIQYFNESDVAANSKFFAKYNIALRSSYEYGFRIYKDDALVGTANLIAYYPTVNQNGFLIHKYADKVLEVTYGDKKRKDMYNLAVVSPGRFYDREHVLHIAIIRVLQNIMIKDVCGNPLTGIRAGAFLTLAIEMNGRNLTIARMPLGSEVPVDVAIPVDEWGNPLLDIKGGYITAVGVVKYFDYDLYAVDDPTKIPATAPTPIRIPIRPVGAVAKPEIYIPVAAVTFFVEGRAVSVDYDPPIGALMGFVVSVASISGKEIARGISNRDGLVYIPGVPIGVEIVVTIRTIDPNKDRRYSYTFEQTERDNSYARYAKALDRTPADDVYTLGTRGAIDKGLVVNTTRLTVGVGQICEKANVPLGVTVYDLVVRVFDKTGTYLLKSQPVYFGPYPQATKAALLNVTLILADSVYEDATLWRDYKERDYYVLTDFRAMGATGMKPIYRNLAEKYLSEAKKAAKCGVTGTPDYAAAINAYALASMAGFLAETSTDHFNAEFLLRSRQPKSFALNLCEMTVDQLATAETARLFLNGQRLRFVVWYMGQKVFDDYVTITGPEVKIFADVYPVNITAYTKSLRLPVDAFVGFTLTDVYLGLALNRAYNNVFANETLVHQMLRPFNATYKIYGLNYLLRNELAKGTQELYNVRVTTPTDEVYYGSYVPVQSGGDFVYLPNIMVWRNATQAVYQYTVVTEIRTVSREETRCDDILTPGRFSVPAMGYITITLTGGYIEVASFSNATYAVITAYAPEGGESVMDVVGTVLINDTRVGTIEPIVANKSITLTIRTAADGAIYMYSPDPTALVIYVSSGSEKARVRYTATNETCIKVTEVVTVYPGREFAVTFDRWLLAPGGQLYHALGIVNRETVLDVLTHAGSRRCAEFEKVEPHVEDDEYVYRLTLRGVEVANFRTLLTTLPWSITGDGKALVNITAAFKNGTVIDSIVYNLTEILAGVRANEVNVTLALNFGKVADKAYDIARTDAEVVYTIRFYMYKPTEGPKSVCAVTLVPLGANYTEVSMYECEIPVVPGLPKGIDPTTVIYAIDPVLSGQYVFDETFNAYGGFGTPITYVVKSGEVALLPSWYNKTSVAGSRIARIWIIAANEKPEVGPALGTDYDVITVKDYKGKVTIPAYKFRSYLVVNYVPNVCKDGWVSETFLDEFDGSGRISGLGFGTGGTSSLVISNYTRVAMWNSTAMWLAEGRFKLPTVALDALTVMNNAGFPIYVKSLYVQYRDAKFEIPMPTTRVERGETKTAQLGGYGFGRTYMFNVTDVWAFRLVQPNYRYGLKVYHGGVVDALKHFGLSADIDDILKKLTPLATEAFIQNVLYASHAEETRWTYKILNDKIVEVTRGMWGDLRVDASDIDYKYVFSMPTLPLREIRDWNDRPLANQTVVLFDRQGRIYAITYTDNDGRLAFPLPNVTGPVVRVSWFNGYLHELVGHGPQYTIWIYDSTVDRDVTELGNAVATSKVRTYVYPLTVTVKDNAGAPIRGVLVKVYDSATGGVLFNAQGYTGEDGSLRVVELRVSKYPTGVMSQVPATSYGYEVYYNISGTWVLGASETSYEIQRGASVPATGYNLVVTLQTVSEVPAANTGTRGYIILKNVKTLEGTRDVRVNFEIRDGRMKLEQPIAIYNYDVEVYVTHVTIGGTEVPVKGGAVLAWRGTFTRLAEYGIDFAKAGITSKVRIIAKDAAGAVRSDWPITVMYRNITAATGMGELSVVLPRSDVVDGSYTVSVTTTAKKPDGTALVVSKAVSVVGEVFEFPITIGTVKTVVSVVDGFGKVRGDWPIEVVGVARGAGQLEVELVAGESYTAKSTVLGYTAQEVFTPEAGKSVVVKIPTAKIIAQVVDGFGVVRTDWPIDVVNVASGRGTVEAEVLAGTYTAKTTVFGKEFTASADVKAGEVKTVVVKVPTAKLSVRAVDDDRKPLDKYVTAVEISGPVKLQFAKPPEAVEVLEGGYTVTVTALGKQASTSITLASGAVQTLEIVVPGTAGLDFFDTRIPLPTLVLYGLLLLVVVIILAILIIEYNNWRRRRLMQILSPPK